MKNTASRLLLAAAAIVAVSNAIVLGGAAWNRNGTPESTLRLTERELRPAFSRDNENSGLAMRVRWRVLGATASPTFYEYGEYQDDPAWLDAAKMASVGFDTSLPDTQVETRRSFRRQLAREVFLVLELDGPAYRASLRGASAEADKLRERGGAEALKLAERIVPLERDVNSRLFVVDAGLDAAALRAKYPDRAQYAVVRGRVEPSSPYRGGGDHRGRVSQLSIGTIHVPLELRGAFEGATPDMGAFDLQAARARYEAEVAFGQRLEPWLATAARKP